jgi:hypothetical protein
MGVSPASVAFPAATALPPYATSSWLPSNKDMVSGANMLQQSGSLPLLERTGPTYRPGAFHPITRALPKQLPNEHAPGPTPYVSASEMIPLSFDAFDLPQDITPPEQRLSTPMPPITPENLAPPREINSSAVTSLLNMSQSATPARLSVQPPNVADDPILLKIMRQAQSGLFVISDS